MNCAVSGIAFLSSGRSAAEVAERHTACARRAGFTGARTGTYMTKPEQEAA
ncbi:MAG TPA: hypothetical protein VIT67_11390 [Povalibacter sp.]